MPAVLAFPLRVVNGRLATVAQGSDDEITQSAYMALLCPLGHRPLLPNYGAPNVEHTRIQVDRAGILRAKAIKDEPRISDLQGTEKFDALLHTSTVTLARGGA